MPTKQLLPITITTMCLFGSILCFELCAQPVFSEKCGNELLLNAYEKEYPGFKKVVEKTFNDIKDTKELESGRNDVYTIDVVFHVVWKDAAENLHDSILENQINLLNKDYRLQNENRFDIRSIFKDRQADAQIEFSLKDIKRVKTNSNFALSLSGLPDNVKRSANGGSDALNPEKHLNIWICNIRPIPFIGGQILGYAYPPAGLSNWPDQSNAPSAGVDGVVLDFRIVGSNNPNKLVFQGSNYDSRGRTCTHEVGHYLGLRHIWGDGGGIFGGSSCDADDGMEDTPNQGEQTGFSCDKTRNTCTDPSNDLPDMLENYMDYADESCQNTFTKDQVSHMRKVLQNQRSGLVENQVSSKAIHLEQLVHIFPNPFLSGFNIINEHKGEKIMVKVFNLMGTVVHQGSLLYGESSFIECSKGGGIYPVLITTSSGSTFTKYMIGLH
ncbi:MAG: zinc-dependent metalloprotease [Saprospiraceae bacterium]